MPNILSEKPRFNQAHVRGLVTARSRDQRQGTVQAICSCGWEGRVHAGVIPHLLMVADADFEAHRRV